ncbi:MAG: mediator of RNA polymerase II transcription complex subunit 8-domain-containing protein [Benniella sp.]|nr:MAG: mediator of RNA polymerase II transcription complex subunit 8-domain-containing protein [Benniella sp.]
MNATFPQTEINIEALESVKTRLFQLQESILFFLRSINPEATPGTVQWTELHSKFNVLIAKYLHLTNLLNDPHSTLLQSYTVFPNESPANDQQVQNLSVLLRTKLFPELEQEMEDRIKDGDIPGLTASGGSTAEERKILQALKLRVMMHDALCQTADEIFENQRDMVDTKVRYESDDDEDDTQKEAGTSVSTEQTTDGIVGGKQKAPSIDKDKQHATNTLAMDGFAIGDSASSIRYLSDWGSTPNDVDGYSSGTYDEMDDEELRDFDDSYFERRRHDEHDEWSNESEPEEFQDEDEQDTFMEVSLGSQAIEGSAPNNSMSVIEETFDDGVGSGEEDMEEVM